jgi:hypothetical protein
MYDFRGASAIAILKVAATSGIYPGKARNILLRAKPSIRLSGIASMNEANSKVRQHILAKHGHVPNYDGRSVVF